MKIRCSFAVLAGFGCLAQVAHADVVMSEHKTQNMACDGGVCVSPFLLHGAGGQ